MSEPQLRVQGNIISIKVPLNMKRHGGRKFILIPKNIRINSPQGKPDETMVKALARAWMWQKALDSGKHSSIEELAVKNDINPSYISRMLRLNLLAPDIKQAILDGTQPRTFNLQGMLAPFPESWEEQAKCFGFQRL
jgi:hypothetical protein